MTLEVYAKSRARVEFVGLFTKGALEEQRHVERCSFIKIECAQKRRHLGCAATKSQWSLRFDYGWLCCCERAAFLLSLSLSKHTKHTLHVHILKHNCKKIRCCVEGAPIICVPGLPLGKWVARGV